LAPLADDVRMLRLAMLIELATVGSSSWVCVLGDFRRFFNFPYYNLLLCCSDVCIAVGFLGAMCCRKAPVAHRRMWFTLHLWLCLQASTDTYASIIMTLRCRRLSEQFGWLPGELAVIFFISRPRLRERCQHFMNKTFERKSEKRAAAGVAGLMGGCSAQEVISQASLRFRSVQLADLCYTDLEDNTPNPELFVKTAPEDLNRCDAFISHSWHDDAHAKWQALQRWRGTFVAKHGREPKVWFDKCCIDQNNIDHDLRCLPIFLSGCKRMVVFCGPSYLSRLWCIMELFTFVHIGRGLGKIDFELVQRPGFEEEDLRAVERGFEDFDAERCRCFHEEDKERMRTIIKAAFGATAGFNKVVREIFNAFRMEDVVMRSLTFCFTGDKREDWDRSLACCYPWRRMRCASSDTGSSSCSDEDSSNPNDEEEDDDDLENIG